MSTADGKCIEGMKHDTCVLRKDCLRPGVSHDLLSLKIQETLREATGPVWEAVRAERCTPLHRGIDVLK